MGPLKLENPPTPLPPARGGSHIALGNKIPSSGRLILHGCLTYLDGRGVLGVDDAPHLPQERRNRPREKTWISRNTRTALAVSFNRPNRWHCARATSNSPPS